MVVSLCAASTEADAADFTAFADLAARAVAVIRMWPKFDQQDAAGASYAELVASCLELGVARAHAQLLIQPARALTLPQHKAAM